MVPLKTKAVRIYGANDLRLEEFDLPEMQDDEILAKVISDSICMSSYKACVQGAAHKRVPADVAEHPVIIGHEFCGEILKGSANAGKTIMHPAINLPSSRRSTCRKMSMQLRDIPSRVSAATRPMS